MTTKTTSSTILMEHRCACGKLLFKGLLLSSTVEIKCKGCGNMNLISGAEESVQDKNDYSILFDDATNIIDASPSATEILGFERQKLLSMKGRINFLYHMHLEDHLWQTAKALNFESFTFETVHITQSGQILPVRANIRFIKTRGKVFALATFERLQTQAQQFESQNNHAEVMDFNCQFVADVNMHGVYTYVNRALITLLGYSAEEMIGQPMFKFYPQDEQTKLEETFQRHLKLKQSFKLLPRQLVCKNGEPVSFENYFVANAGESGSIKGFHVIMA